MSTTDQSHTCESRHIASLSLSPSPSPSSSSSPPSACPPDSPHLRSRAHSHPPRGSHAETAALLSSSLSLSSSSSATRTPPTLVRASTYVFHHSRLIQSCLFACAAILLVYLNLLVADRNERLQGPSSSPSGVASSLHAARSGGVGTPHDIRISMMHRFRGPRAKDEDDDVLGEYGGGDRAFTGGIAWLRDERTQFQTERSTYAPERLEELAPHLWPPALLCPVRRDTTDTSTLAVCLLGSYFPRERDTFPTLLRYLESTPSPPTVDEVCERRLLIDVEPTKGEMGRAPAPAGRMLRDYLSLMGLAGMLGAHLLHPGTPDARHPYWRWSREVHRSAWFWHSDYSPETDTSSHGYYQSVDQFDVGQLLSMRQWETDRRLRDACPVDASAMQRRLVYDRHVGRPAPKKPADAIVDEDEQDDLEHLLGAISDLMTSTTVPGERTPIDQPNPPFAERLEALRSSPRNRPHFPGAETRRLPGMSLALPSWSSPLLDGRMLLVLEIRMWLRHTIHQLIYGAIMDQYMPDLLPVTPEAAEKAESSNHFTSPAMMRSAVETEMRKGHFAKYLVHGFELNEWPRPWSNPRTYTRNWRAKRTSEDDSHVFNSWPAVFDTYFSTKLHWAVVIKQRTRVRAVKAESDTGPTDINAFDEESSSADDALHLAVPVEYLQYVVPLESIVRFVARLYRGLAKDLRQQVVLALYVDATGLRESDLAPTLAALAELGVHARLYLNIPLATQTHLIAMSDVQAYFCVEPVTGNRMVDDGLDIGSCAMSAFFRSEPLKLFIDGPQLPRLYPYVRNVLRLHLDLVDTLETVRAHARDQPVNIGRAGRGLNGTDYARAVKRTYPALPSEQLRMVPLEELRHVLRFHPSVVPPSHDPDAPPPPPGQIAAAGLRTFARAVRRVLERKHLRLRHGGVPFFLENYEDNYPVASMLLPE